MTAGPMLRRTLLCLLVTVTCAAGEAPAVVGFTVQGELIDDLDTVRDVVGTVLSPQSAATWSPETRERLDRVCDRLLYECRVSSREEAGGVIVDLVLEPLTLVRFVTIEGNDLRPLESPIFDEELARRLTLRPGSKLPHDPAVRRRKLEREAASLEEFLANEGYFEARVKIAVYLLEDNEAELVVAIDKGPAYTVGPVTVYGNSAVPARTIVDMVQQRRDLWRLDFVLGWLGIQKHRFSKQRLDEDLARIEDLYQRRGFPRVRVTSDFDVTRSFDRKSQTVKLTIRVKEYKRIDVAFRGNRRVGASTLVGALTFAENRSYDDHEAAASALAIRRAYQSRGFFQAVVTWRRERIHQSVDRIVFRIDEGRRLPVRQVSFKGNQNIEATRLLGLVKTRPLPGRFARLLESGGYLTSLQLAQDAQRIRDLYREEGFSTAQVQPWVSTAPELLGDVGAVAAAATTTREPSNRGLHVQFRIDEGPRDSVRRVSYVDNHALNDRVLDEVTVLDPGSALTEQQLEADTARLLRLHAQSGYPYARVDSYVTPAEDPADPGLDVVHVIDEGQPVSVGEVILRGNFLTDDWVIRQNLQLQEGDAFTTRALEEGQRQLRNTRLFSNVRLDLVGAEERRDPVHVVVSVAEGHDNRGIFELTSGFSTDNLFFAGGTYDLRNIGGVGASFVVSGEVGFERQIASADFALPLWWMRRYTKLPVESDVSVAYLSQDHERFGKLTSVEAGARLSRQFGTSLRVALAYTWRTFGRREELVRPAGANQDLEDTTVATRSALLGPAIVYDKRRDRAGNFNPVAPARGYRVTASAQVASRFLGGDSNFVKLQLSAKWHHVLGARFTLTHGFRYDHGIPLGSSVLLPEVERFFAGGDTTVRGLSRDRLYTEVIRRPLYPGSDIDHVEVIPAGGNIRALHNIDLQLEIWGDALPLASAVFVDSGIITNSLDGVSPDELRHSVGIAFVRLILPAAGSASFEWAIPLDPRIGDDPRGRIHFNLGFVF